MRIINEAIKELFGFKTKKPNKNIITSDGNILTKNGHIYYSVDYKKVPKWVWKKFDKQGTSWGSFKGKHYRYIIEDSHGNMPPQCWKRKISKK